MFCRNCGTQINENAKFCDNCGTQTAAEQTNILAQHEENRKENPPAFFGVKNALMLTVIFFVVMPVFCLFKEAPIMIGFITAGASSALVLILGIINQIKHKKKK